MKDTIKQLATDLGCTAKYSGKEKTMFITGENAAAVVKAAKKLKPLFEVKLG